MYIPNLLNLGEDVILPNMTRNYAIFDEKKIDKILSRAPYNLSIVDNFLKVVTDEKQVLEGLYVVNRMIDNNISGAKLLYPTISRFNQTNSPNIQTMLAGIYRKTLIPDAFGPLNSMFLKQTFYPNSPYFDPKEEIGGAILEYLKAKSAIVGYSKN